jgi:hypothetical protein
MNARKDFCPTKAKLVTAWNTATEIYSRAVAELSRQAGALSKPQYEKLKLTAEDARKRSMQARAAVEAHIADHGCHNNDDVAA